MKYKCKKCGRNIDLFNYSTNRMCDRCTEKKARKKGDLPASSYKYFQ